MIRILQCVVCVLGVCERGDSLVAERCFHATHEAQLCLLRAREPFLRHRVEAQAAVGLSLIRDARVRRNKCHPLFRDEHVLKLARAVGGRTGDNVKVPFARNVTDRFQHLRTEARAVVQFVDARAKRLDCVKSADIAAVRKPAEEGVVDAPAAAPLAAQLARKNGVHAASKL